MTPTDTYACGSASEKIENTCNKPSDSNTKKKDCCDKENGQCTKDGKNCDGKCGNSACHCPSNSISFTIPFFAQLTKVKVIPSKSNFYYQEIYYSSGFLSIWLPPKIR